MNEIELITQVGFPIFVALYFMIRFEKTISENTRTLQELKTLLQEVLKCR